MASGLENIISPEVRNRLKRGLKATGANLSTAVSYGLFELMFNAAGGAHGVWAYPYAAFVLTGFSATSSYFSLKWQGIKTTAARMAAQTLFWLVAEDAAYWMIDKKTIFPYPVDNWWARVYGQAGEVVGAPAPVVNVPVGYLIAAGLLAAYVVYEAKMNRKSS